MLIRIALFYFHVKNNILFYVLNFYLIIYKVNALSIPPIEAIMVDIAGILFCSDYPG